MDEFIQKLEKLTKMSQKVQNQKLRNFLRVDIETKLKIFDLQRSKFHQLKELNKDDSNGFLTLASLILATDEVLINMSGVIFKATIMKGQNIKRRVKRERLLGYWAIVKMLRDEQNMSFRQIAQYFRKYYKFEVAHSTICELWNSLQNEGKTNENG